MIDEKQLAELSLPGAPRILTEPPGPQSRAILEYQAQNEGSAVSYARGLPMAVARSRGATQVDADGNIYIDMFSGAGVMALGGAHPEILAAAHAQIDEFTHTLDIPSQTREGLVETLKGLLPRELTRIFFGGPTGSDAVEQALKLAKWNKKRNGIIAFEGAYHGMTGASLAVTTDSGHRDGVGELVPGVSFVPYAYSYRNPFGCPPEETDLYAARWLDRVLRDSHSGVSKPAAVIIEAVQGEGGTIAPPPRFLQNIRRITQEHDVLLICDEIQCGLGRTGRMFAFEHSQIVPDIVTLSKALGGLGFPISAIAYREELNTLPPGKSIGTFRGNMTAFAAGKAALEYMVREDIPGRAALLGEKLLARLKDCEARSAIVGEVRGIGLMLGIELVKDKTTKEPAPALAAKVRTLAHRRGVLVEVGGHFNHVIRLLPPLVITEELAFKAADIIESAIGEAEKAGCL
ncbi:MAG: aspartate aminotransferase family protein [Spirochaetales bacterium]|jgi:diaminobutyrate-2-oxoglutarate transaminase|nr:aspartate aminotransferase family protein [Spirochaetales bacterium]